MKDSKYDKDDSILKSTHNPMFDSELYVEAIEFEETPMFHNLNESNFKVTKNGKEVLINDCDGFVSVETISNI